MVAVAMGNTSDVQVLKNSNQMGHRKMGATHAPWQLMSGAAKVDKNQSDSTN